MSAINLHSATLYYTTDTDGVYTLTLTARLGSYSGLQLGITLTQNVTLSSSADTPVTWKTATYTNPDLRAAPPVQDVNAFTCP